jgi:hypothetical protein
MSDEMAVRSEPTAKSRGPKLSAERALPTVGAEQLVRIIKGYAVASNGGENQVNYKDVASATGLNPTIISGNNTFLTESGIITSPKYGYYVPSEEAVRFARESAWDEENAKSHLRRIVLATWYGQVTVQNFATRLALSRDELRRVLGIKCGASEADGKALNYIVDFLIYLRVVSEAEDELLRRGNTDELAKQIPLPTATPSSPDFQTSRDAAAPPDAFREMAPAVAIIPHPVSIVLNVTASIDQLTPENAQRLREWMILLNHHEDE